MIMMVDDMVLCQVCEENGQLDVLAHKRLILYLVKRLSMPEPRYLMTSPGVFPFLYNGFKRSFMCTVGGVAL